MDLSFLPDRPFVRGRVICQGLGISQTTLRAMSKNNRMPQPVRVGKRLFLYPTRQVREAILALAGGAA